MILKKAVFIKSKAQKLLILFMNFYVSTMDCWNNSIYTVRCGRSREINCLRNVLERILGTTTFVSFITLHFYYNVNLVRLPNDRMKTMLCAGLEVLIIWHTNLLSTRAYTNQKGIPVKKIYLRLSGNWSKVMLRKLYKKTIYMHKFNSFSWNVSSRKFTSQLWSCQFLDRKSCHLMDAVTTVSTAFFSGRK